MQNYSTVEAAQHCPELRYEPWFVAEGTCATLYWQAIASANNACTDLNSICSRLRILCCSHCVLAAHRSPSPIVSDVGQLGTLT